MRKQIKGLTQASANAEDGISAVQTAEGALNEVHDMLQRMNELAVKAANGTQSESDRDAIQDEINQITTEIDRVSETTKFNETYLLKGDSDVAKVARFSYKNNAANTAATVTGSAANVLSDTTTKLGATFSFVSSADQDKANTLAKAMIGQGLELTGRTYWEGAADGGSAKTAFTANLNGDAAQNFDVVATASNKFDINDKLGNKIASIEVSGDASVLTAAASSDAGLGDKVSKSSTVTAKSATAAENSDQLAAYYDKDGNKIAANALNDYFGMTSDTAWNAKADAPTVYDALGNTTTLASADVNGVKDVTGALQLTLHVGADATANNQINVNIDSMSAKGLGVNGLKVNGADDTNALNAIDNIKVAIQKVSDQRSSLGAVQNRLEHTIKNLDNVVENTTAAESAIRDTDMAAEMVKYSNNNILMQAGQSMLAQANQSNQGVLSLLG